MIEILESPKYLVAMKVSGNLTADDVAAAYKAVEDALKEHERISFFAEVEDTIGITLDGLVKDFIQVKSSHPFLMRNPEAIRQPIEFLTKGKFVRDVP